MPTYSTSSSTGITLTTTVTIAASATVAPTAANAIGVDAPGIYSWTVDNAGVISALGSHGTGIYLHATGAVSNASSGTITANTATGYGIVLHTGGSVINQAGGTISGYQGIDAANAAATVVNGGSIAGVNGVGIDLKAGGTVANLGGGTIRGASDAVLFGAGVANRLMMAPGAVFTGAVNGGNTIGATAISTLELMSGAGADTLSGLGTKYLDFGNVTIDAGATWLWVSDALGAGFSITDSGVLTNLGSLGSPVTLAGTSELFNVSGATIAAGSTLTGVYVTGSGTLVNGGSISGGKYAVLFKPGFTDRLVIDPGAVFSGTVNGGNTIGATAISTLELAAGATAGTLSGLGTQFIDFSQIVLDPGAAWTLTGGNTLVSGVTLSGTGTATDAGTLTNAGSISSLLMVNSGAVLTNASQATIGAAGIADGVNAFAASTIVNAGRISGSTDGVLLSQGGVVTNQSGGTIIGTTNGLYASAAAAVTNAGTISGTSFGIQLNLGGSVTNLATGVISGVDGLTAHSVTVVNYGHLSGSLYGLRDVGGSVTNHASGVINGGSIGVYFFTGGTLTNAAGGTISGGIGVEFQAGSSTVVNAGTIIGTRGMALELADGSTDRLVVDPGAKFVGTVVGGFVGFGTGTMELASGASAGTVSALGANYTGFTVIQVDGGAQWTLTGTSTLGAGQTLTNAGSLIVSSGSLIDSNALVNNGLLEAVSDTIELGGSISGTGELEVASGGVLRLDGSIGAGQTVAFGSGAADTLILSNPGTGFSEAITGFAAGDRIELGSGVTITGASINTSGTITLTTHAGSYVLNHVSTAPAGVGSFVIGTDTATGDSYVQAVVGPQTDVWTGASGTNVATAGSWNDLTAGTNPASAAPGTLDTAQFLSIGGVITGTDTVSVLQFGSGGSWSIGPGTTLTANSGVTVGNGLVEISSGGSLIGKGTLATISGTGGESASVLVTGTHAVWNSAGSLVIGNAGLGALAINQGGTVITGPAGAIIANTTSASGSSVNVTGIGASWTIGGTLDVGNAGAGALNIAAGATVSAAALDSGIQLNQGANPFRGTGAISLSGPGSELAVSGTVVIADSGTASLSITDGATLLAANMSIGRLGHSSGEVLVSDPGSTLDVSGTLSVGTTLGTGQLTIGPGGTVIAHTVIIEGEIVNESGDLDPNTIVVSSTSEISGTGVSGGVGDVIVNDFIINAQAGKSASTMTVLGTITGTGTLQIESASTLYVTGGPVGAGQSVVFKAGSGALILGDVSEFGGTIAAFMAGDTILLQGTSIASEVFVGNTLTLLGSGGGTLGVVDFASGALSGGYLAASGGAVVGIACFAEGTRLATSRGSVAVEALSVGSLVRTESGAVRPITWIGHRTVECARHPKPAAVWPVRIAAGAFGGQVPHRDLYLSPDHAVYVNEVLIPVRYLVNGTTIVQVQVDRVTYYHVELPSHDVVLADGLPTESYLETGDRANFANGGGVVRQFPDFAAHAWEAMGCAPLVVTGKELAAARARLRDLAVPERLVA